LESAELALPTQLIGIIPFAQEKDRGVEAPRPKVSLPLSANRVS
jgi:hypothetical protein